MKALTGFRRHILSRIVAGMLALSMLLTSTGVSYAAESVGSEPETTAASEIPETISTEELGGGISSIRR